MSILSRHRCAAFLAGTAAVAGTLITAVPAHAAQSTQQVTCGATTYTIRTNDNHSSDHGGWSAAQIVGQKGHGIPTRFSGTAVDLNTGQTVGTFDQVKGQGNANQNQATTTCTQTFTAVASDFFGPSLPPGVSPGDQISLTVTIQVVIKQ